MRSCPLVCPVLGEISSLKSHIETLIGLFPGAPPVGFEPGELVQLKPTADDVLGGTLLRVEQSDRTTLRGYLLCAHRGGGREAWWRAHQCDVDKVGRLKWPESEFSLRPFNGARVKNLWTPAAG